MLKRLLGQPTHVSRPVACALATVAFLIGLSQGRAHQPEPTLAPCAELPTGGGAPGPPIPD